MSPTGSSGTASPELRPPSRLKWRNPIPCTAENVERNFSHTRAHTHTLSLLHTNFTTSSRCYSALHPVSHRPSVKSEKYPGGKKTGSFHFNQPTSISGLGPRSESKVMLNHPFAFTSRAKFDFSFLRSVVVIVVALRWLVGWRTPLKRSFVALLKTYLPLSPR